MTDWTCIRRDVETELERNHLRREYDRDTIWWFREAGKLLVENVGLREELRVLRERVRVLTGCAETAERQLERERTK